MTKHTHTHDTCQRITVQRASENDSKDIWEWRNDELTKKMFITTDSVSWETHSSWYEKSLTNPNRYLYLGLLNSGEKVGMCRFDVDVTDNVDLPPYFRSIGISSLNAVSP